MLYLVQMDIVPPRDPSQVAAFEDAKIRETAYAQELQRLGVWKHLWRVVGKYANYSVFEVASNDELHQRLSSLPLFPYMTLTVTPLARHPSAIGGE